MKYLSNAKSKWKKGALISLCATLAGCLCIAGGLLGGNNANAMTAENVSVTPNGADIWNPSKDEFDQNSMQDFLVALGKSTGATKETKTYSALKSAYSAPVKASALATANGGANGLNVRFGGYNWTVTYLSANKRGDLIATLWYADSESTSPFSANASGTGWVSLNAAGGYSGYTRYSNHYGGSYLRAVTLGNGGDFWSASGTSVQANNSITRTTATAAQVQASAFYKYAQGAISEYLDAPSMVSWQQVEYNSALNANRTQNDNLTQQTANWSSATIQASQGDELYYQWANDKIWLPGIYETGWNASNTGIWGTTTEQRKSASSNSNSWLRSAYFGNPNDQYYLNSSGNSGNHGTSNSDGVRPAIHLNLAKAANADIWNSSKGEFNKAQMQELLVALGKGAGATSDTKTYADLASAYTAPVTASTIATANGNSNGLTVKFGGYNWTVAYLSNDNSGNLIATLWYKDIEINSPFAANASGTGWYSDATHNSYAGYKYSNHYGASYLRAVTLGNGGDFWSAGSNNVQDASISVASATPAQIQASAFYEYAQGSLSTYLVAPNDVAWQQVEKSSQSAYRIQNETLTNPPPTDSWYNTNMSNAAMNDPYYNQWGADKIWLPSLAETGNNASDTGIWGTTTEQRKSISSASNSWSRSAGANVTSAHTFFLNSSGNSGSSYTNSQYGVRPAIHLNLSMAMNAASGVGIGGEFPTDTTVLQNEWNAAIEESLFGGGKQVTYKLSDNWQALPDTDFTTSFGTGTGFATGRLFVPDGANIKLDLNGHVLDRNLATAQNSGGVFYVYFSKLEIFDSSAEKSGKITGGKTRAGGGGIYVKSGTLEISDITIKENTAEWGGGGISVENGKLVLNSGTVCSNKSLNENGTGGGIYVTGGTFNMFGGEISNNNTKFCGGGVHVYNSDFNLFNGEISNNRAAYNGGGMYINGTGKFEMYNGTISNNTAGTSGAGLYNNCSKAVIKGGLISNNVSTGTQGGGITSYQSVLEIYGGKISNNKVNKNDGGGIYGSGTLNIYGGEFSGNTTGVGYGGGICWSAGTFNLYGGTVSGNRAGLYNANLTRGGGIYLGNNCVLNMYGGVVTGNQGNLAGGIYVPSNTNVGTFNLYGGTITGNTTITGAKANVYLESGRVINVMRNFVNPTNRTFVGVSMGGSGAFTSGYVGKGNILSDGGAYFFADNGKQIVASGTTELTIGTANATAKSNLQWKYTENGTTTNIAVTDLYQSVPYTGNPYTVSLATGTIYYAVDESGRTVTSPMNPGKYYFSAQGLANYNNPTLTFEILPGDISEATITVSDTPVYNGKAHTPEVTVALGGKILEKDKDYTVSYYDNINAGKAGVVIEGKGYYGGAATGNFAIEKRNVEIRWGELEKAYTGSDLGCIAHVEGAINGDTLSVSLYYQKDGKKVTPLEADSYVAYAALAANGNYKLAPNAKTTEVFKITPKIVEAVWSGLEYTYNGSSHMPTASYTDIDGTEVPLTVTVSGAHTDAATYTATATIADSNYAISTVSVQTQFTINKVGTELVWGTATKVYDGTAISVTATVEDLSGASLASGLSFEYFDEDGVSLGTTAPINAGKYKLRATLTDTNYALADASGNIIEYSECEIEITAGTAGITWTFANDTFDGTGKAPVFTFNNPADAIGYTVTYAADNGSGAPADEYTSDLPIFAGDYLAKVVFDNGDYEEIVYQFTVNKMSVAVVWSGDNMSLMSGASSYKWLYDGSEHAPKAVATVTGVTVDGTPVTALEVTVSGMKAIGSHTATAVLKNTDLNDNFTLTNDTQTYSIERSTITSVEWYSYGSSTAVAAGAKPEYLYIEVYGRPGPKLSAYGIATMTGTDGTGNTVTRTAKVALSVSYSGTAGSNVNPSGYWDQGEYVATAALSGDAAANCTMSATALTLNFAVTSLKLDTAKADVEWVFDNTALTDSVSGDKYWEYDGNVHAPQALAILDRAAYTLNPADTTTFEVLPIGGAMTDAGVYYAYILPCDYDIDDADADLLYEIRPRQITIQWAGVNNGTAPSDFEWTYNGIAHAPTVSITGGTNGLVCNLKPVVSYVNAGTYTAVAEVDGGNFVITNSATQTFTIKQMTVNPNDVAWTGVGGGASANDFKFPYDGNPHAPAATLTLTINGAQVNISLTVSGETSAEGQHVAYATLNTSDMANANFILTGAECRFSIDVSAVRQIIWDNEDASGNIEFVYDGTTAFCPTAYYWDDSNNKVTLNVLGGRTEAGEYIAYVTDNTGLNVGMTHKFTVKPMELNVSWTATTVTYNGTERRPDCTFTDGGGNAVALVLNTDYTVTGFTTAGTYTAEITFINGNYTYVSGTETTGFTISPKKVTITWTANLDGTFNFEYNGAAQRPAFTSDDSSVTVTVTGAEAAVGSYVAVASVDDNNYYLSDAKHTDKAECEYKIVPFKITVDWKGENGDPADFSWEYDGNPHAPEAYFVDWSGDTANPVQLSVRGEKTNAGTGYTAVAIAPENCEFRYSGSHANAGSRSFDITAKVINNIIWKGENGSTTDFTWKYDGTVKTPTAETAEGDTLAVTGSATDAGTYKAAAVLPNAGNYTFGSALDPTKEFTIAPMEVAVKWYGKDGGTAASDYDYDYTGSFICPTAKFEDVSGNLIDVPVNGGAATAGQNSAEAVDIFANYSFDQFTKVQPFSIKTKPLTITWSDSAKKDPVTGVYTYEYNGKAQMPLATSAEGVNLSYVIKNAAGDTVGAVINAGTYTVTVSPASMNHTIDAADATVQVEITPKTVAVQWGSLTLDYTGGAIAPKAWFVDVNNQAVELDVTPAQTAAGTGYAVTADFKSASVNYVLDTATVNQTFDIEDKTVDTLIWDWATGSWITATT